MLTESPKHHGIPTTKYPQCISNPSHSPGWCNYYWEPQTEKKLGLGRGREFKKNKQPLLQLQGMTGKDIKVLKLSYILFFLFFFFCPEEKVLHKWKGKSKTEGPSGPTQDCERRWAPGLPHPNPVWMRTTWSQWAPRGGQAEETLGWALLASWGSPVAWKRSWEGAQVGEEKD